MLSTKEMPNNNQNTEIAYLSQHVPNEDLFLMINANVDKIEGAFFGTETQTTLPRIKLSGYFIIYQY